MKILSLFDGMSVAQQAISELYKDYEYYASEIDEYAITTTQSNFPKTLQFGSVTGLKVRGDEFSMVDNYMVFNISLKTDIDLLIGGSPCQDLSIAKKDRKGLDGERSGLFYEYVRIRDEVKPKYFILENVASMSKESKDKISEILGVQPVMINASLVSAQNRKRLFWVGKFTEVQPFFKSTRDGGFVASLSNEAVDKYVQVHIPQPADKGVMLKDILEKEVNETYTIKNVNLIGTQSSVKKELNFLGGIRNKDWAKDGKNYSRNFGQGDRVYSPEGKSATLSALGGGRGAKTGLYQVNGKIRKLTPTECLRLQSMPDNYFDKAIYKGKPISNSQRYKMCGNAFNKEVIKHILKNLK